MSRTANRDLRRSYKEQGSNPARRLAASLAVRSAKALRPSNDTVAQKKGRWRTTGL